MQLILERDERRCYRTLLADLIQVFIQNYQNFVRMPSVVFDLIYGHIHHCIKKGVANFRKPLQAGLKLAIPLWHQATAETYTSLQYHWLVGQTTMCKFIPIAYWAIIAEFQELKKSGSSEPDVMKCPPRSWGTRQKTYCQGEALVICY